MIEVVVRGAPWSPFSVLPSVGTLIRILHTAVLPPHCEWHRRRDWRGGRARDPRYDCVSVRVLFHSNWSVNSACHVPGGLTDLLTGLTFFLLGALRLGTLIGFFPRHILVGYVAPIVNL